MSPASVPGRLTAEPVPPAATTAGAFIDGLRRSHQRLFVVADRARRAPVGDQGDSALAELRDYLVNELNPVLHALALRVYPPLRRRGLVGPGRETSDQHAHLLRLTERLATIREASPRPGEIADLVEDIATLAEQLLLRALRMLPALLGGLTQGDAVRLVGAAQQTIRAGHHLPHAELHPALL